MEEYNESLAPQLNDLIGAGGGCFHENTPVYTLKGYRPICQLQAGDAIYSFNEFGKIEEDEIEQVLVHPNQALGLFRFWGGKVLVTPIHWFLSDRNSFKEAQAFDVHRCVMDVEGGLRSFHSYTPNVEEGVTVYNLIVKKNHTYIAGGLRVHNGGGGGGGGKGCFSFDTLIETPMGDVPISSLKKGDKVFSFDEKENKHIDFVDEVLVHENEVLGQFEFNGGKVLVTPIHWMLSHNNSFTEAQGFSSKLSVVNAKGYLQAFQHYTLIEGRHTVYNLLIKKNHTFIAGGLRVHNGGGGGGGGKSGGNDGGMSSAREVHEDPESLRSRSYARVIDALCEGEIEGLVDTYGTVQSGTNVAKGVYVDGVPLMGSDGVWNYADVLIDYRTGTQDQSAFAGVVGTESTTNLGSRLRTPAGGAVPLYYACINPEVDEVEFGIRVASLVRQDKTTGDLFGSEVSWQVDYRINQQVWLPAFTSTVSGKTSSAYMHSQTFAIPKGGIIGGISLIEFRLTRITPDSTSSSLQNETYWDYVTERINAKFKYPNTAMVGIQINAEQFASIPSRAFDCKLLKIKVPTNYDPSSRAYTGIWDGSFKVVWSDNPAWCFYDLVTNSRYGLGDYFPADTLDKWTLYTIGQYCDELVPSGYGGNFEPRFTCNLYLQTREEAYKVATDMASIFRAMLYWGNNTLIPSQDRPKQPLVHFHAANVKDGRFSYTGSAKRARHTCALVAWNNPITGYAREIEYVEDVDGINRFGVREVEVAAFGCTSRGQAHRLGKWILYTERKESDLITFRAGMEGMFLRPGDLFKVSDSFRAGVINGGRIMGIASDRLSITLDRPLPLVAGATYTLHVQCPQAFVPYDVPLTDSTQAELRRTAQIVTRTVLTPSQEGTYILAFAEALPSNADVGMIWTVESSEISAQLFRTLTVEEIAAHEFEVTGMQYDLNKFAEIEQNIVFDPSPISVLPNQLLAPEPPTNLAVVQRIETSLFAPTKLLLDITWDRVDNPLVSGYLVYVKRTGDNRRVLGEYQDNSAIYEVTQPGEYTVEVQAVTRFGKRSKSIYLTTTVANQNPALAPSVTHLEIYGQGNDTEFLTRDVRFTWMLYSPSFGEDLTVNPLSMGKKDPYFSHFIILVRDSTSGVVVRTVACDVSEYTYSFTDNFSDPSGPRRSFIFEVYAVDIFGAWLNPATITVANPPPALPQFVELSSFAGNIVFKCAQTPNVDFKGYLVWISSSSGFDTQLLLPAYEGANNPALIPITDEAVYYIRFAEFDVFGKTDLIISDEVSLYASFRLNPFPPAYPKNLALNSLLVSLVGVPPYAAITATWDANTESDLSVYEVSVSDNGGISWINTVVQTPTYTFEGTPGLTYRVQVRATNTSGVTSPYCPYLDIIATPDAESPDSITGLTSATSFNQIFLSWTNPTANDFRSVEVWEASADDFTQAVLKADTSSGYFTMPALTDSTHYFWLIAKDFSANESAPVASGAIVTGKIENKDLSDFAINASKMFTRAIVLDGDSWTNRSPDPSSISWNDHSVYYAGVKYDIPAASTSDKYIWWSLSDGLYHTDNAYPVLGDDEFMVATNVDGYYDLAWNALANAVIGSAYIQDAAINNAKIADLAVDAAKIADLAVTTAKIDDLAVTDAKVESLSASKIVIAGTTTLADWRHGADLTKIDGGTIAANTIAANSATFGLRGLDVSGLQFECQKDSNGIPTDTLGWTAGSVSYVDNDGNPVVKNILSGETTSASLVFVYYDNTLPDGSALGVTPDPAVAYGADKIVLATFAGGLNLNATYGRTKIDGSQIIAGSVTSDLIRTNTLNAEVIQGGTLDINKINADIALTKDLIIGDALGDGAIRSRNYDPLADPLARQGFIIDGNGNAEFYNMKVRQDIVGGTIKIGLAPEGNLDGDPNTGLGVDAYGNFWIGKADYATAPFRISKTGELYFELVSPLIPQSAREDLIKGVQCQISFGITRPQLNAVYYLIVNSLFKFKITHLYASGGDGHYWSNGGSIGTPYLEGGAFYLVATARSSNPLYGRVGYIRW